MDIISHGLWGGVAFGRKNKGNFWIAFIIGIMPDMLSFGVHTVARFFGWEKMTSDTIVSGQRFHEVPAYVNQLYNVTHSLVVFAAVFLLVWLIRKKPWWLLGPWALHILVDIPSHSLAFFPTPFLWPVSNFHVNGINWGNPVIFIPNLILLCLAYMVWGIWKLKKDKSSKTIK